MKAAAAMYTDFEGNIWAVRARQDATWFPIFCTRTKRKANVYAFLLGARTRTQVLALFGAARLMNARTNWESGANIVQLLSDLTCFFCKPFESSANAVGISRNLPRVGGAGFLARLSHASPDISNISRNHLARFFLNLQCLFARPLHLLTLKAWTLIFFGNLYELTACVNIAISAERA